jgi:hypothetical protein
MDEINAIVHGYGGLCDEVEIVPPDYVHRSTGGSNHQKTQDIEPGGCGHSVSYNPHRGSYKIIADHK